MDTIKVKDKEIPAVGLGTWELSGSECTRCVTEALKLGYRHIDTAQIYDNERQIGNALKKTRVPRKEIFLVTKIATTNFKYDDAVKSVMESLEKLKTDYIDLILLHWPNSDVPLEQPLDAMNELKERGKVKYLGLSNYPPSLVDRAAKTIEVFCNQIEYHPYLSQDKLLKHSAKNSYLITAYCPIAKGRIMKDATISDISEKYGKTPAQLTLRWLFQQGVASIPKSSSKEHLRENLDIFDFELERKDMDRVSSLSIDLHLDPVSYLAND